LACCYRQIHNKLADKGFHSVNTFFKPVSDRQSAVLSVSLSADIIDLTMEESDKDELDSESNALTININNSYQVIEGHSNNETQEDIDKAHEIGGSIDESGSESNKSIENGERSEICASQHKHTEYSTKQINENAQTHQVRDIYCQRDAILIFACRKIISLIPKIPMNQNLVDPKLLIYRYVILSTVTLDIIPIQSLLY
jgi:hypothetical protein